MPQPVEPLHLVGPVRGASRLQRRAGVLYTEVGGAAVLCDVRTAACHALSPAGAALWAALDGGPLDELLGSLPWLGRDDAVDLARRLRAVGVVEDAGGGAPAPPPGPEVATPRAVRLRGRAVDGASGVGIVVDADAPATAAPPTVVVELGISPSVEGVGVAWLDATPREGDAPHQVLAALVRAHHGDELTAPLLDGLAALVDHVPLQPDAAGR